LLSAAVIGHFLHSNKYLADYARHIHTNECKLYVNRPLYAPILTNTFLCRKILIKAHENMFSEFCDFNP